MKLASDTFQLGLNSLERKTAGTITRLIFWGRVSGLSTTLGLSNTFGLVLLIGGPALVTVELFAVFFEIAALRFGLLAGSAGLLGPLTLEDELTSSEIELEFCSVLFRTGVTYSATEAQWPVGGGVGTGTGGAGAGKLGPALFDGMRR